ncbi:MAG: hydrolase, partial [Halobacteriaceae archaeon]
FALGRLADTNPLASIDGRALIGVAYGLAAFFIPPPTMTVSYPFVFSVLSVGIVGVPVRSQSFTPRQLWKGILTGLAGITIAGVAYLAMYLLTMGMG